MKTTRHAIEAGFLAVVFLVGCEQGSVDEELESAEDTEAVATGTPEADTPARQRVVIVASNYAYLPNNMRVAPGPVTFVISNAADMVHGFEVEGHGMEEEIESIDPGTSDSLTVTFDQPGEYEIYCPVADHQSRGMVATLTVGG